MEQGTLVTIAEMGITIVGVAGLVAAFLSRGGLHPIDRLRFMMIVKSGMIAAFAAYAPIWISRYVEDSISVWQYSSALALLLLILTLLTTGLSKYGQARNQLASLVPRGALFYTAVPLVSVTLLATNAFSWPVRSNQTVYEVFLFLAIFQAVTQFISMVMYRAPTETT